MEVPVVDVGDLFSAELQDKCLSETKSAIARLLLSAFEDTGIAYLRFEGSSSALLHEKLRPAFTEARSFFSRSREEKESAKPGPLPPGVTRGYLGIGVESGAEHFELKEAFSWSFDWESVAGMPGNGLEAYNVWPRARDDVERIDGEMKRRFDILFNFFCDVMVTLVDAVARVWPAEYGARPDLLGLCSQGKSISLLRSFHYQAADRINSNLTGSSEHTDWGFATLVAQEPGSESALQVSLDGKWYDVPPLRNTLVVNCSDFLSMVTNGRLRSPVHRVALTKMERFSFVFFQYPGFDTPVPQLSEEGVLKTAGLSLLKDQSADASKGKDLERKTAVPHTSFGEFIAMKWQQVSRP